MEGDKTMKTVSARIPGYTYGTDAVAPSPVAPRDLDMLKRAAGFTEEGGHYTDPTLAPNEW